MNIPSREHLPTEEPDLKIQVTDDGSRTLVRTDLGDAYHSGCGALAESRVVYLENSGMQTRLQRHDRTRVLEIGFGTGMNAILTAELAIGLSRRLHYQALDLRLPAPATFAGLGIESWVADPKLAEDFLRWGQLIPSSTRRSDGEEIRLPPWIPHPLIEVDVRLVDFLNWEPDSDERFDVIYFDAFAPATDGHLWTTERFSLCHNLLSESGCMVTYCVSRAVRDACESAGLNVRRVPGPEGGKREVMIATKG